MLTRDSYFGRKQNSPSGNNSVVECNLAKVEVAGSNPVSRSKEFKDLAIMVKSFFLAFEAFVSVYVSVWR